MAMPFEHDCGLRFVVYRVLFEDDCRGGIEEASATGSERAIDATFDHSRQ